MVAHRKLEEMSDAEKALLASFYGFGRHYLGLPIMDDPTERKVGECRDPVTGELYYEVVTNDRQKQVLDSLDAGGKVSARTCNGAGKTTMLIPTAVLGFMAFYPRAKVVITSGVERQVRAQVFPALKACERRLAKWDFTDTQIMAPNGSVAIGFATNDGGRFEGWHGNKDPFYDLLQHDGPLLIVVDEAKSVKPQIFDAIDRCTYQALMLTSSCGGSSGEFYQSHTKNAAFWRTHHIAARHCPHADHAKNAELIHKRGLTDHLVRSKVFAEFMGGVEGACIQRPWVEACIAKAPPFQPGTRRFFCDFAAGGDENVIAEANGNRVRIVAAWREKNTMQACGQFIDQFRRLGLSQDDVSRCVSGDEGGLGKGMLDRLQEIGWQLLRVNNGSTARDKEAYRNRGAEMWFEASRKFELGRVICEGFDDRTIAQLTERQGFTPSDGRREIESKEDMRERGLDSPDRADAIVGALMEPMATAPIPFAGRTDERDRRLGWLEQMADENEIELAGANAG
jgi:phage terminase large subunit